MSGLAPRRRTKLSVATALVFATFIHALPSARMQAAEAPQITTDWSSNRVTQAETGIGPQRLRQQVRVTVETNGLAALATTNAATKEKSFQWKLSWEGWRGLHYDLSQRTRIENPLAEVREKIEGTNDYRVFHLEEVKMSGKIGAKLAVDGAAYVTGSEFKGFDDGAQVRRARVYAQGDCLLLLPVSYELEVGYIPNQFYIENSYLAFRDIDGIGDLKFGQYQAPMGLEVITSSRDATLMEPAAPIEALAPGISAGVQIGRPVFDQRATWKLGLFTEGAGGDVGDATKNYGRLITRLTGLPFYEADPDHPDSATLLHLGLSANVLYSASSSIRYRSRPESHLAPYVVDTGNIKADSALVTGAEAAWVSGPFSVQGEYLYSRVQENNGQAPGLDGVYASVSWFVTGESRPYDRQNACFARVVPHHNFDWGKGGWGAWEVAGRYSWVNLESDDVHGGRLSMLMAGVNWYLNPNVKWRFEYGFGHVADKQPAGNLSVFQTRVELDF